jgi:hypothetical protein
MRNNLEKTIERERGKAKDEERRDNAKEFERIFQLEESLRNCEVSYSGKLQI